VPASFVAWRCASLKYAGTVMTAFVTGCPRYSSAAFFSFCRTIAEICGGAGARPCRPTDLHHHVVPVPRDAERHHLHLLVHFFEAPPHEALDGEDRVFRIGDRLPLRHLPDQALAGLAEADNRRREPPALGIGDDNGLAAFHDGHH